MVKSIVLVADSFPPSRTSAALQLKDLAIEFLQQGLVVSVITVGSGLSSLNSFEEVDGVKVLRLKTPKHRNVGIFRRGIAEILIPFFMIRGFQKTELKSAKWDAVIWYSPTIFLGPFIWYLKRKNVSRSCLILRDIFPAWAVDLGLIKMGLLYYIFRCFEKFQYSIADCIGVQATGNLEYFEFWPGFSNKKIEVLQNWLTPRPLIDCSVSVSSLTIANRKIFVYAGNMGIAQGIEDLLVLAEAMLSRIDVGFLFIGRGSALEILRNRAQIRGLVNIVFCDEINPDEIPGLYAQCHIGLISLDARHKTHNIPGKFLSYLQSGLPVMAIVNDGNDLFQIIEKYKVGKVTSDRGFQNIQYLANSLLEEISLESDEVSLRCKKLAAELFSSNAAANKIIDSLNSFSWIFF